MNLKTRLVTGLLASVALLPALLILPAAAAPTIALPPPRPVLASAESPGETDNLEVIVPVAPASSDVETLPLIFRAYRNGDWTEAHILKSKLTAPAAVALSEWFAIRAAIPVGWERLAAFARGYPDWPATALLRRRMEEALLVERRPAEEVRAFFADQPPTTGSGRIALAFALKAEGLDAQANEQIRKVWREDTFGDGLESRILDRFPGVLKEADHRFRMERYLLKENWSAATRAAGFAGKDYTTLVKARMGLYRGKKNAEKAFAAVPAALRKDSSYIFSRALYLRRSNQFLEAAAVMAEAPRDPELLVDGDEWWAERRLITRELLDRNDPKTAYAVASHHGAESPAQQIEAEFHSGWIALRFLNDPTAAARHFAAIATTGSTPISTARVAYWQGRAAEAAGQREEADKFYALAAGKPTTYYGQLATSKLAQPVALRQVEPLLAEDRAVFEERTPIRALKLLSQTSEPELLLGLYNDLAQTLDDPRQLDALASIAAAQQNPRAVLLVGKVASQRGFPLDLHAYPLAAIPDFSPVGDEVEPAMIYAIARQESAFNPRAVSSAGARGLMQLMPATAKRTAQRFGVGFDLNRLVEDPAYNAKLGSAHLGELMEDWKGSHILAFASYNAGGGNVIKWVRAYGDPRQPGIDLVDWIERIPFYETRNYVQRVMENLTVYRERLTNAAPATAEAVAGSTLGATADAVPGE
ncbi:lytic transglycosylase domain-containing protein [Microvirga brassicacearum]|uniref:Lytic transglycosylase domain-containing protein n=1 Tax=Microvirga brassicacearum TaxID=2580413 RepID=A0A5N3P7Z2_9HYPH|nr:lytic transglycosylase domain-containing protein [Microvirga brassicacearum]KAB0265846.1 lytic transglycosylase domain-containing protein [Microvirga brassicacearum]